MHTAQVDSEHTALAVAVGTGGGADIAADALIDLEVLGTTGGPYAILVQCAGDALADAEDPHTADPSYIILTRGTAVAPGTAGAVHVLLCADTRFTPSPRQGLSPGPSTTPPHINPATTTRIPRYPQAP